MTPDKELTQKAIEAVHALRDADVLFAITSGRPPRGMSMLIEPLGLTTPIAAFNGGLIVEPDMTVMEQKLVPESLVRPILSLLESHGLVTWIYRGADWYVRDPEGPARGPGGGHRPVPAHRHRQLRRLLTDQVVKIVGVSDDHDAMARATEAARDQFSDDVTAAQSQPYYLDVTHPEANKGGVVKFLSAHFGIDPSQIATIGDMPNDVLMFAHSGLEHRHGQRIERGTAVRPHGDHERRERRVRQRRPTVRPEGHLTVRNPIQKEE